MRLKNKVWLVGPTYVHIWYGKHTKPESEELTLFFNSRMTSAPPSIPETADSIPSWSNQREKQETWKWKPVNVDASKTIVTMGISILKTREG